MEGENWKSSRSDDRPAVWLGNAIGVHLEAPGLHALALAVADGAAEPLGQALALFRHVSQLPFEVSDPTLRTLPEALPTLRAGDGYFKATLWLHLLRICHIPARMRWVELDPTPVTHGLWDFSRLAGMPFFYPLVEVWLGGSWQTVDAYAMDPPLFDAVMSEIVQRGLPGGYFVHRQGTCSWDGRGDALQRFSPLDPSSRPLRDLGCHHSHADFMRCWGGLVPETAVTHLAYENQARMMNQSFARMRAGA